MVPNDIWLRTEWLSCRRTSVLRCVESYCAAAAREYRRALRRVQEVEETIGQGDLQRRIAEAVDQCIDMLARLAHGALAGIEAGVIGQVGGVKNRGDRDA